MLDRGRRWADYKQILKEEAPYIVRAAIFAVLIGWFAWLVLPGNC